ncbi:S-adenosylmethionine:tRNA ribosyltransferase-isomerase [Filobacillus milosensis]|uniref:S-adenosylmethionine:tRNA ribosyltransferase-isomerase n=1 Tax=Filobacillus milosensis TaxID=94137 RepID=A0A4Y8ISI7_9BACI|nr:S-adenosylmethionine:tRNA ribosyltransferase-isomerase [Filobacillus milosensis]TFB21737.1 S-adenosylmethionine:tRNA ribosyltransferase-isomerase [Filobacillus milosensis]
MTLKTFEIPKELNASVPAEYRNGSRDQVKLMVTEGEETSFSEFQNLTNYVKSGDVMIFNNTRTIPAGLKATYKQKEVEFRLSQQIDEFTWEGFVLKEEMMIGEQLIVTPDLTFTIVGYGGEKPLVQLQSNMNSKDTMIGVITLGEPIRYDYINHPYPINTYQTVYGSIPGSMEMPSAGRAFTWDMLNKLKSNGVNIGFIQLYTGLSYYEKDQWPNPSNHPERYNVSQEVVDLVNKAKHEGRRVIAVGTTVVRALESAALNGTLFEQNDEYTNLYVNAKYDRQIVDSLLTGLHEPEASHLDMLTNWIEKDHLIDLYHDAMKRRFLWHEFGDLHLIL